jgi:hypothetical protein
MNVIGTERVKKGHVLPIWSPGPTSSIYTGLVNPEITRWQQLMSSSLDLVPRQGNRLLFYTNLLVEPFRPPGLPGWALGTILPGLDGVRERRSQQWVLVS